MKIKLYVKLQFKNSLQFRFLRKEYESNCIPHTGDYIEDPYFAEPDGFEIARTIINYRDDYCNVYVKPFVINDDNEAQMEQQIELAMAKNWKIDLI